MAAVAYEIVADYADTGSLAATGRRFGLSRERVRQIVASAGDANHPPGKQRYSRAYREQIALLAAREGITRTATLSGVAVTNLRVWIGEFVGRTNRPSGAPTREAAAARDFRIRAALADLPQRITEAA